LGGGLGPQSEPRAGFHNNITERTFTGEPAADSRKHYK